MKFLFNVVNFILLIFLVLLIFYLTNLEYKHYLKLDKQIKLSTTNLRYIEKFNFEKKRVNDLISLLDKSSSIYNYSSPCTNGISNIPVLNNTITMKDYYYFINSFSGFYCRHDNEILLQYNLVSLNKEHERPYVQDTNYVSLRFNDEPNLMIEKILYFQYSSLKTYNDILELIVGAK